MHFGIEKSNLFQLAFNAVGEKPDPGSPFENAPANPHKVHHSPESIVPGIKHQRCRPLFIIDFRSRNAFNYCLEQFGDTFAGLTGNTQRFLPGQSQDLLHLLIAHGQIGCRQVDLVDHRNNFQSLIKGQIDIGNGLRLHALRGIDQQNRTFTGTQTAADFISEVNVSRSVDQVKFIGNSVTGIILHTNRVGFDGNSPFPFQIHSVEELFLQIALGDGTGNFQHPVGEGGFAVVDMGDDTKISYAFEFSH